MTQMKLPYVLGGALVVGFAALSILSYNSLRTDVSRTTEIVFFTAVKDSTDKLVLASYLERYPTGLFAKAVQARMDEIAKGGGTMIAGAGANPAAVAALEQAQKAADEAKANAQAEADKLLADARAEAAKAQQMAQAEADKTRADADKARQMAEAEAEKAKAEAVKAQQTAQAEAEKAKAEAAKAQQMAQAEVEKTRAEAAKAQQLAKAEAEKSRLEAEKAQQQAKAEAEKAAKAQQVAKAEAEKAKAEAEKAQQLAKAEAEKTAKAQQQIAKAPPPAAQPKVAALAPAPTPAAKPVSAKAMPTGAAFVVISSTAEGLKKGDRVSVGDQIAVPPGTRVVLMDGTGKVINVRGPFNGAPGGSESSGLIGRLSDALSAQQDAPRRVGAFRGVAPGLGLGSNAGSASPWTIDVTAAGDWCVASDQAVSLTGASDIGADTVSVELLPSGPRTEVPWPKGQATVSWPSGVPTKKDATYNIRFDGQTTAVKLHLLERKGASPGQIALWMAEQGCQKQAAAMIDSLESGIAGRLFDIEVRSEGRANSEYKIGDELKLSIQASREAYVYCFYRDVAGEVTKIFPSQFDRNARVAADGTQAIPAPSWQQPMQLTGPGGASEVQCFALDRDATAHLPPEIARPGFTVLPTTVAASLMDVFKSVPEGNVATAAMPITVKE